MRDYMPELRNFDVSMWKSLLQLQVHGDQEVFVPDSQQIYKDLVFKKASKSPVDCHGAGIFLENRLVGFFYLLLDDRSYSLVWWVYGR